MFNPVVSQTEVHQAGELRQAANLGDLVACVSTSQGSKTKQQQQRLYGNKQ